MLQMENLKFTEKNKNEYKLEICQRLTATTDLGNWRNGKLVLYLVCFGKSENRA